MLLFEDYTDEEMVDAVLAWADDNPDFDTTFIDAMSDVVEERGELTERQRDAVERIAVEWGINIGRYV